MFTTKKLTIAIVLVLFVGGPALPVEFELSELQKAYPDLPPLEKAKTDRPDLVIEEIKAHYDAIFEETVIELKVKNCGRSTASAWIRLTGSVTYGRRSGTFDRTIQMSLRAGDSKTVYLGALPHEEWPSSMTVGAQVDTPTPQRLTGAVWESDEFNNKRTSRLVKQLDLSYEEG